MCRLTSVLAGDVRPIQAQDRRADLALRRLKSNHSLVCHLTASLQETYGQFKDKIDVRIWRRGGRALDKAFAQKLFNVINDREDILRRLIRNCAYLKYVEGRLGDRVLLADEILRDGFCVNLADTPLCPLNTVTNLQEAVWDADVIINGLPSTETRSVFRQIGLFWRERRRPPAVIVSLAKGVEAAMEPEPHIVTPTLMIHQETGVPMENILYLGGPNIAAEIYNKEYANARLCGAATWRVPMAAFLRQRNFAVWDNSDLVTHEVMGGLKNVYAIGAGIVAGSTRDSATSKSVYFAHSTSEMIFVTHLLTKEPERLAGPLLADTYVTLLKGRNAWYGQQLAEGRLTAEMGDMVEGKGLIQGVSAVAAFYTVLSEPAYKVPHPVTNELVAPIELCPILQTLYHILHVWDLPCEAILDMPRDENMDDPCLSKPPPPTPPPSTPTTPIFLHSGQTKGREHVRPGIAHTNVFLCPFPPPPPHPLLSPSNLPCEAILDTLRDENMYDPAQRIASAPERCYVSKLLDQHPSSNDLSDAAAQAVNALRL
ncbi:unnamed protein product [Closterium sp. NIES-65]|nr:unnamed protein product [Closterium sp. NIES-65]